jgi:hypothetical protein
MGRARSISTTSRQAGAVARQADHPHVVAEVLAAELGADAHLPGHLVDGGLHLQVAEGVAGLGARRGQAVQIVARRQLHGLERQLRAGPADHHG